MPCFKQTRFTQLPCHARAFVAGVLAFGLCLWGLSHLVVGAAQFQTSQWISSYLAGDAQCLCCTESNVDGRIAHSRRACIFDHHRSDSHLLRLCHINVDCAGCSPWRSCIDHPFQYVACINLAPPLARCADPRQSIHRRACSNSNGGDPGGLYVACGPSSCRPSRCRSAGRAKSSGNCTFKFSKLGQEGEGFKCPRPSGRHGDCCHDSSRAESGLSVPHRGDRGRTTSRLRSHCRDRKSVV